MTNLNTKAWLGLVLVAAAMWLLLFVPAWTINYWQAWVYIAIYITGSLLTMLYLMIKDPALLARRMRGGPVAEKDITQKIIMYFASAGFIASLVIPSLDHRFGWSRVPLFIVIIGDIMTILWFCICFLVFKENTFTSATIEISQGHKVISTGPYAVVRHPMYAGGLLLFSGAPLALGSYWGLLVFLAVLPALIWRLLHEEKFLAKNLPGYTDYCAKVRWRLIPKIF